MDPKRIASFFLLALLLVSGVLIVFMLRPFLTTLAMAAILAFLCSGVYARLLRVIPHRSIAAFIVTIGMLATILIPVALVAYQVGQEAAGLYGYLRTHTNDATTVRLVTHVRDAIHTVVPTVQISTTDITARLQDGLGWLAGLITPLFSGITRIIIQFLFLLMFFFYLLRDGSRIKNRLMLISPLPDDQEERIAHQIGQTITATIRGKLLLSVIQGLLAGIGFIIFGVPNPALWGGITMLATFIPSIGSALVHIPAIAYLFAAGHTTAAIGLTLWAIFVVGTVDNVLGPKLMAHGGKIHPLAMMLSVLGGIAVFGPVGLFIGPVVTAFFSALLDIALAINQRRGHSPVIAGHHPRKFL